jgi:hypothetical protein
MACAEAVARTRAFHHKGSEGAHLGAAGIPAPKVLLWPGMFLVQHWYSFNGTVVPAPDRWFNIVTGAGAAAGALGVVAGAFFAARYGRRASVSLTASVLPTPVGFVIVARPSVKAVGIFRVRFVKGNSGSKVMVVEMYQDDQGEPQCAKTYPRLNIFGEAFVDGGEELVTTTLIPVPTPAASVIGWAVWFEVHAPNRFLRLRWLTRAVARKPVRWAWNQPPTQWLWLRVPQPWRKALRRVFLSEGWSWTDQVFLPLPKSNGEA